ncbi:MAG: BolA family transcriptional regulator [Deltaproteobacteria bacterium]|jgi:stress-induced morphogen|nr:BolA family transcriptional regulator [Deltaproteobacteria bacterium]
MERTRESRIKAALLGAIRDAEVYLENESHHHSVPKGSETHFKLLIVSDQFIGLSKVARQRLVYSHLDSEFKSGLHALTLRAVSFEERDSGQGENFVSPECLGGKGAKHSVDN